MNPSPLPKVLIFDFLFGGLERIWIVSIGVKEKPSAGEYNQSKWTYYSKN